MHLLFICKLFQFRCLIKCNDSKFDRISDLFEMTAHNRRNNKITMVNGFLPSIPIFVALIDTFLLQQNSSAD